MHKYATIKIEERMTNMLEARLHHTFHLSFLLLYPTTWIYVKQDSNQLFLAPKVTLYHLLIDVVRICTHTSKKVYLLTMFTSLWFSWMGVAKVRKSTRGFLLIRFQAQILNFCKPNGIVWNLPSFMVANTRINLVPMGLVLHEYMAFVGRQENHNLYLPCY